MKNMTVFKKTITKYYTNRPEIRSFTSPSLLSSSLVEIVALDTTLSFCLDDNMGPFLLFADVD